MPTIQHSVWDQSPGLSLLMASTAGGAVIDQSAVYAVSLDGMYDTLMYGDAGDETDPWTAFTQAAYEPDARRRRPGPLLY